MQVLPFQGTVSYSTSVTTHLQPFTGCQGSDTTISDTAPWPVSGALTFLRLEISAAPGSGASWTFTLMVNGVDTAVVVTIGDSATVGTWSGSLALTAGDLVILRVDPANGPATGAVNHTTLEFEPTSPVSSGYVTRNTVTSVTQYAGAFGAGTSNVSGDVVANISPLSGNIVAIHGYIAATTSASTITCTLYKNGVAQDGSGGTPDTRLAITSASGAAASASLAVTVPMSPGDTFYVEMVRTSGATRSTSWSCRVDADEPSQSIMAAILGSPSASANRWAPLRCGEAATGWSTSTSLDSHRTTTGPTAFTLSDLYVTLAAAPDAGNSRTFTVRPADVDSALSVTIADTDVSGTDLAHAASVTANATLTIAHVPASTPTVGLAALSVIQTQQAEFDPFVDLNHQSGEVIGLTWVEVYHVDSDGTDTTYLAAPVDLNDPSTYYGGYKPGRLIGTGEITRALSDSRGQYEAAEWSWVESDTDHRWRTMLGVHPTKHLLNRHALMRMIDDASRRQLLRPRVLVRGVIRDYQPLGPLQMEFTARDFLASKFGPANLEKQIPQRLITRLDFPDCPVDVIGTPVPIIYGQLSDAGSSNPPPVLAGTASRGSVVDDGVRKFGFGDLTSAASPVTGVTLALGAGNLQEDDVPDSKYGVVVTAVDSDGNESDPADAFYTDIANNGSRGTFASVVDTVTVGSNDSVEVSWTTSAGAATYRAYLGHYYFGAFFSQYIETTHPTNSCTFTDAPKFGVRPDPNNITSGANVIRWTRRRYYAVSFVYADGETALSPIGVAVWKAFRRPFRVEWDAPAITPLAVKIYASDKPLQAYPNGWSRMWTAAGSATHFDDDNLDTNVSYIQGVRQPSGAVPLIHVGEVLDETADPDTWQRFLLCGHAVKEITDLYVDGKRLSDDFFGEVVACPGKSGYSTYFPNTGNPQYVDINGHRYTCVMIRGPLSQDIVSEGKPLTANVKGVESVGDGSGTLITALTDIYKHLVINWFFQSYESGAWLDAPDWPEDVDGTIVSQVDETSFDTVKTIHATRVSGGYPGAIMFGANGESITLRDALARMNLSADCQSGFNRHSQFFITAFDHRASILTSAREYTQLHDIIKAQFDLEPRTDEVENVIVYSYQRRYAGGDSDKPWDEQEIELRDQDAINDLREERKSQALELWGVRSSTVAGDIAERRRQRHREPPTRVTLLTNLKGLATELGDVITVDHIEGVGSGGWTDRPLRVMRHITNPGEYTVKLECEDVERLFSLTNPHDTGVFGGGPGGVSSDPLDSGGWWWRPREAPLEESIAYVTA